jgi:hypothetical protein
LTKSFYDRLTVALSPRGGLNDEIVMAIPQTRVGRLRQTVASAAVLATLASLAACADARPEPVATQEPGAIQLQAFVALYGNISFDTRDDYWRVPVIRPEEFIAPGA